MQTKGQALTIADLRKIKGFAQRSEKELERILNSLRAYTGLISTFFNQQTPS